MSSLDRVRPGTKKRLVPKSCALMSGGARKISGEVNAATFYLKAVDSIHYSFKRLGRLAHAISAQ